MAKTKKRILWAIILIYFALIALIILAVMLIQNRPQYLFNNAVSLHDSVTLLQVSQGQGFGQDVTHKVDREELLYLLSETQMWRENSAWSGTQEAEWVLAISQTGNRFHRTMTVALGETHGMMTERGFGVFFFRLSNGDAIIETLERMVAE